MDIETSRQVMTVFYLLDTGDITDTITGEQSVSSHYGANGSAFERIMGALTVPVVAGLWTEPDRYKVRDGRLIQKMPDSYEMTDDGFLVISPPVAIEEPEPEPEIEPGAEPEPSTEKEINDEQHRSTVEFAKTDKHEQHRAGHDPDGCEFAGDK